MKLDINFRIDWINAHMGYLVSETYSKRQFTPVVLIPVFEPYHYGICNIIYGLIHKNVYLLSTLLTDLPVQYPILAGEQPSKRTFQFPDGKVIWMKGKFRCSANEAADCQNIRQRKHGKINKCIEKNIQIDISRMLTKHNIKYSGYIVLFTSQLSTIYDISLFSND